VVKVWYNVVGVLSDTEIAIYVNGVKEASKPLPVFTDTHSADVRIGSSAEGGGYAYFNGVIDNVQLFESALSGKHINAFAKLPTVASLATRPVETRAFLKRCQRQKNM
jgi:hypothetical protein